MFKYNKNYLLSLELCIREGVHSFSAKIPNKYGEDYIQYLLEESAITERQFKFMLDKINLGISGYFLVNIINLEEVRFYMTKPNLYGYTLDSNANIIKEKNYIDNYYISSVGEKKEYHILTDFSYPVVDIPSNFVQVPFRALYDDNGQYYYEYLSIKFINQYLDQINMEYEENLEKLVEGLSYKEIQTWPKQEQEAKAYLADNSIHTPFIDSILSTRDKYTKNELAAKIVDKANTYSIAVGQLTGIRQFKEDSLLIGNKSSNNIV